MSFVGRRCIQTTNNESLAGVAAVSPTAKGAHNGSLAPEERTVQKKKQALSLALHIDDCSVQIFLSCNEYCGTVFRKANVGSDSEDEEGAQDAVDRAFATFVAAHKMELSIFCSSEWANVLAAAYKSHYNEPTVLLARAPIHLLNRLAEAASAGPS